jgi:heptosyltransferase II
MILKKAEWTFKKFLMKFLSKLIYIKKYDRINIEHSISILVIRQHNQLGDMLCATPFLRALRERFPNANITLISGPVNTKIVQNNPFLNHVIEYNNIKILKSPGLLIDFLRELRNVKYDFAVVPVTVSTSVTSDLIAFFSRARYRIGAVSLCGVENRTGFLYNFPVYLNWKNGELKHQTQRNIDIMHSFSLHTDDHSLIIGLSEEEKSYGDFYFQKTHIKGKMPIGIHPGAGKLKNQWPVESFRKLIDRLIEKDNCEIYMTEGPMDKIPMDYFREKYRDKVNIIKENNIRNVAAIIDKLGLFISNDTGVMHVAAATGTPVLSLFGETDPLQWAPQRNCDKYIVGRDKDIRNISVDKVYELAVKMIKLKISEADND